MSFLDPDKREEKEADFDLKAMLWMQENRQLLKANLSLEMEVKFRDLQQEDSEIEFLGAIKWETQTETAPRWKKEEEVEENGAMGAAMEEMKKKKNNLVEREGTRD
ncbi:hypothetical protein RUND412_007113 [Rhizina undulata]